MMVMREGTAAPGSSSSSSGFVFDPLAEGRVFGSVGNAVLSSVTPEDIVAYVGPHLRAALHGVDGPLQLLDVVRQYQNHHRQLFPTPPAASVLTGLLAPSSKKMGTAIWGEFPEFDNGSPPLVWPTHPPMRLSRHHPDGLTDGLSWSSASSSARNPEVSTLQLPSPPSSPVFRQSPVTTPHHYCNSSGASSPVINQRLPEDYFYSNSSRSSSPLHAFRPVRAPGDHWVYPSPRYSSRRSSSSSSGMGSPSPSVHLDVSPSSTAGFTSRHSIRHHGDRPFYRIPRDEQYPPAPASSPDLPSSLDFATLVSPSFVHDIRAAVVSLLIVLQHCTIPS